MFKFLNKMFRPKKRADKGQIALIMILIIAIAFIFFAVVLNIGKISQIKATTTIAANTSAALMGSFMTGWAEYLYQTVLFGDDCDKGACDDLTICGWTGVAASIVGVIVMIISILTLQPEGVGLAMAIFSYALVGLAAVGVVSQVAIINPAMSRAINEKLRLLGPADQCVEQGILTALQNVVTDNKRIDDIKDYDMDGYYTTPAGNPMGLGRDTVTRFSKYFNARLDYLVGKKYKVKQDVIEEFQKALEDLLYRRVDGNGDFVPVSEDSFGLWDPVTRTYKDSNGNRHILYSGHPCNDPLATSYPECNPCCVPGKADDGYTKPGEPDIRPDCCYDGTCGTYTTCPVETGYPWIYNPIAENSDNNPEDLMADPSTWTSTQYVSFREWLGRDDENPNDPVAGGIFRKEDATGIFSSLWDAINMDLSDSPRYGGSSCFWCDARYDGIHNGLDEDPCVEENSGITFDYDCQKVDSYDGSINDEGCCAYERIDSAYSIMTNPGGGVPFGLFEDQCFYSFRYDSPKNLLWYLSEYNSNFQWKPGVDKYCSEIWPYNAGCPGKTCDGPPASCSDPCSKQGDITEPCLDNNFCCEPGIADFDEDLFDDDNNVCIDPKDPSHTHTVPVNAEYWHSDSFEGQLASFDAFLSWAKSITEADPLILALSIGSWIPQAEQWLSLNSENPGSLEVLRLSINQLADSIELWLGQEFDGGICNGRLYDSGGRDSIYQCLDEEYKTLKSYLPCLEKCVGLNDDTCNKSKCEDCDYFGSIPSFSDCDSDFIQNTAWPELRKLENQAKVLEKRRDMILDVYKKISLYPDKLRAAAGEIRDFLFSDELNAVWEEYSRVEKAASQTGPYSGPYAVYGWKSDEGYWRIVRVDARIPTRCGGKCKRYYGGWPDDWYREPDWPWIKSYTKNWGFRRCYTLGDHFDTPGCFEGEYHDHPTTCFKGGTVKSRVIRWDEDKDMMLRFANSIPLWRFIFHHPDRDEAPEDTIEAMEFSCDPDNDGAFIIYDMFEDPDCWNVAKDLLYRGVMSTSCVEYFFKDSDPRGFNLKFVPCHGDTSADAYF